MAQVCTFFQSGQCKFGDSCENLHVRAPNTGSSRPSLSPCVFFRRGMCGAGSECKFSHSFPTGNRTVPDSESKTRDKMTSGPTCKYWLKGQCIHGNDCRFSHLSAPEEPGDIPALDTIHDKISSQPDFSDHKHENDSTRVVKSRGDSMHESTHNGVHDQHTESLGRIVAHSSSPSGNEMDEKEEFGQDDRGSGDYPSITSALDLDIAEGPEVTTLYSLADTSPDKSVNNSPLLSPQKELDDQETIRNPMQTVESGPRFLLEPTKGEAQLEPCKSWGSENCVDGDACRFMHSTTPVSSIIGTSGEDRVNEDGDVNPASDAPLNDDNPTNSNDMGYSTSHTFTPSMTLSAIPLESGSTSHREGGTLGEQNSPISSTPASNISPIDDNSPVDTSHRWDSELPTVVHSDTNTYLPPPLVVSTHDLGEDTQKSDINDDGPEVQSVKPPEIPGPEVIPHWSEYADPLIDPTIPFCKFYAQARCTQGDFCKFRHSLSVNEYALLFREAQPTLWSSQAQRVRANYSKPVSTSDFGVCKFYPLGKCRNGDACTYLHVPPSELLLAPQGESDIWDENDARVQSRPNRDPQVCWEYSKRGYCKRGDGCRYRHEQPEFPEQESNEWMGDQEGDPDSQNDTYMPQQPEQTPGVCWEYSRSGYCQRGDECDFRHEKAEEQADHEQEGDVNGDAGDPPASSWDAPPIDSWSIAMAEPTPWDAPQDSDTHLDESTRKEDEGDIPSTANGKTFNWNQPPDDDEKTWSTSWNNNIENGRKHYQRDIRCWAFDEGHCKWGDNCKFLHITSDDHHFKKSFQSNQYPTWVEEEQGLPPTTFSSTQDLTQNKDEKDTIDMAKVDEARPFSDDDEKTWSGPWDDITTPPKPSRQNKPCLAFGQGYCKWGDDCIFLHITPEEDSPLESDSLETTSDENYDPQDSSPEPVKPIIKRLMFGCSVEFNTECFPTKITSASDSCRVLLANLSPEAPYDEEFRIDIVGLYGTLNDIAINETETAASAAIECYDYGKAAEAVAQLNGQTYNSMMVSARLDSVAESRLSSPLSCYSVRVSWSAPNTFAWVYYPTITAAKTEEKRLKDVLFEGRKLKTELPKIRPKDLGPYPLKIANLPVDTDVEAVKSLCDGHKLVQLGKPAYHSWPTSDIRVFLEEFGPLRLLDVLSSDRTTTKIIAFAQYDIDPSSLSDLMELNGTKYPFIGDGPLWIQPVYHVKYNVPKKHLQLVHDEVARLRGKYKDQCSVHVDDLGDSSVVHLSASLDNAGVFGRANVALQALLHGEIMTLDGEKIWDEYFDLPSGATAVEKLNAKNPYCILLDNSNQAIRIIGDEKGQQQARSFIPRLLKKVRDSRHVVPLNKTVLGPLFDWPLERLVDTLGKNKLTLDIRAPALIIRGDTDIRDKAQGLIAFLTPQNATLEGSRSGCVVCGRQPSPPTKLSCSHVYCEACLQHVLRSFIGPPFTSPKCVAMIEGSLDLQCTEKIPYETVRDVLPILDEASFMRSSFLSYVRSHPEELFLCPTPNCETVYRTREDNCMYRCPLCSMRVCSTCRHEYHGGLTCEERSNVDLELKND